MCSFKMPKNILTFILITSGIVMLIATLEAFGRITDIDLFNSLKETALSKGEVLDFPTYRESVIMLYLIRIMPFFTFALMAALSYYKLGYSTAFLVIWAVVLSGTLIIHILSLDFKSIYFYIFLLGHILLMISLIWLALIKNRSKDKTNNK